MGWVWVRAQHVERDIQRVAWLMHYTSDPNLSLGAPVAQL